MSAKSSEPPFEPSSEGEQLPSRFEVELEFVQSLANIPYVTFLLTQHQIWQDPRFKAYLKYLEYWCEPPYTQFIVYPNCLFVLKLASEQLPRQGGRERGRHPRRS